MSHRTIALLLLVAVVLPFSGCACDVTPKTESTSAPSRLLGDKPLHKSLHIGDQADASIAYVWLDIAEEATARDVDLYGARPTIASRALAIWATAMFDAWAAYDDKAVGSRFGGELRRPESERTLTNKKTAISYASYRSLVFAFPDSAKWLADEMKKLGYDPDVVTTDPRTPEGVGNAAAQAVIDYRRNDGANQLGREAGGDGTPYCDYTNYKPVNTPDRIVDPDRWQPIEFSLENGRKVTPACLTPHWYRVSPFLLESSKQFRPGPPPTTRTDDERLRKETAQVLAFNASLSREDKAIVEFMRDGPRSTGQSGHWLRFAQDVSRRDKHDLDRDVKLYFAVANVAFDAFISCWETKRFYDSSRPWTLIRHYYKGQRITGWAGAEGGVKEMPAEDWHPYSPPSFVTPPFPGYTSGHATVSGACAKTIELFTGSDNYGFVERRRHCELTEKEAGEFVTLDLPTWSGTAEMAARSRALGGYHIPVDNDVGLRVGREIGVWSWPKYQAYFDGSAKVRK